MIIRLGHWMVKQDPVYRPATEFLSSNPLLLERIGGLEEFDVTRWFIQRKELPCTARLRFTVKGHRGGGEVSMHLMSTISVWHVQSATFFPYGSSSPVELTNNTEALGTAAVPEVGRRSASGSWGALFPSLLAMAFAVWLFALHSVIQMARLRTPGVRLWEVSLFDKSTLSPEAWPYRTRVLLAGVAFLILLFSACFVK